MKNKKLLIFSVIFLIVSIFLLTLYLSIYTKLEKENCTIKYANTETNQIPQNQKEKSIIVELPEKKISHLSLSVIGDIMCHNSQYFDAYATEQKTYDFSYVFEDIKEYISSADIAIGNLETTFAGSKRGYSSYPRFNTPEQLAKNLKNFGIDILTTANNHCMDTNYDGLASTLNYLDEAEILHTGTNRSIEEQNTILVQEINNIKIAFLSFTYGTNGLPVPKDKPYAVNLIDENLIKEQIDLAKLQHPDLICVSMHWGIEYQNSQNETQEYLADFLVQNEVDIILGSHPHVLQPMEKRNIVLDDGTQKECFVIYSLGNFMSGQTAKNTRTSIILNIDISKDEYSGKTNIDSVSYIPIYMYKAGTANHKYHVLDLEKAVSRYEETTDTSIGESNYLLFKNEIDRVHNLIGKY